MDVSEIVKKYLIDNGFDGLCNGDCKCKIDDLFFCDGSNVVSDCEPYKKNN